MFTFYNKINKRLLIVFFTARLRAVSSLEFHTTFRVVRVGAVVVLVGLLLELGVVGRRRLGLGVRRRLGRVVRRRLGLDVRLLVVLLLV